jgi:transcriptional regulator with XRE-family HTH domain
MSREQHWTAESADAFAHKLALDFIAQIENRLQELELSQNELARKLGVSEGAVSQVLNNPQNLTLKTIAKYARALGIKAAIVAYNDSDPSNEKGLINPGVFSTCWERAGNPRDMWSLEASQPRKSATTNVAFLCVPCTFPPGGSPVFVTNNWANPYPISGTEFVHGVQVQNAGTNERIAIPRAVLQAAGVFNA